MTTSAAQAVAFYSEATKDTAVWTLRDANGIPAPDREPVSTEGGVLQLGRLPRKRPFTGQAAGSYPTGASAPVVTPRVTGAPIRRRYGSLVTGQQVVRTTTYRVRQASSMTLLIVGLLKLFHTLLRAAQFFILPC